MKIISDGKLLIINRGKAIECLPFMEGRTDFENLTPAILGKTNFKNEGFYFSRACKRAENRALSNN